jgi:nitrogen regulatory protein PII-like uncharacterized protein
MGTVELAYTTRKVIATVVDSDRIDDIADAMKEALGEESSGVLMVSPVDDLIHL